MRPAAARAPSGVRLCHAGADMDIDRHVHASELSRCAVSSEEELVRAAREAGLDAVVFTNHDRLMAPAHLEELTARHAPLRVFGGIEVSLESEHVIVLGIHDTALEIGSRTVPP